MAERTERVAAREGRLEADIATRKAALEAALASFKDTQARQQQKDGARVAAFTLASQQALSLSLSLSFSLSLSLST